MNLKKRVTVLRKLLTVFVILFLWSNTVLIQAQVEKKGYYFTIAHHWKLGRASFSMVSYYDGFVEEERFNDARKIVLEVAPSSLSGDYQLVKERNEVTIEKDHHMRMFFEEPVFIADLEKKKKKGTVVIKNKKRSKIKLKIVYGIFEFEEKTTTVEEYKVGYMGTAHKNIRVQMKNSQQISILKLIDYSDLKILNELEIKKIKVR